MRTVRCSGRLGGGGGGEVSARGRGVSAQGRGVSTREVSAIKFEMPINKFSV